MGKTVIEPQQDRSRATRERLLENAVALPSEPGWNNTTVTTAAAHAGVSRGTAQHHFPTRDDLFPAAIEYLTVARVDEVKVARAREQVAAREASGIASTLLNIDRANQGLRAIAAATQDLGRRARGA